MSRLAAVADRFPSLANEVAQLPLVVAAAWFFDSVHVRGFDPTAIHVLLGALVGLAAPRASERVARIVVSPGKVTIEGFFGSRETFAVNRVTHAFSRLTFPPVFEVVVVVRDGGRFRTIGALVRNDGAATALLATLARARGASGRPVLIRGWSFFDRSFWSAALKASATVGLGSAWQQFASGGTRGDWRRVAIVVACATLVATARNLLLVTPPRALGVRLRTALRFSSGLGFDRENAFRIVLEGMLRRRISG